jgi:hypothetical protein
MHLLEEFKNDQGEVEVQVGDFVSVANRLRRKRLRRHPASRDKAPGIVDERLKKALNR